MGYVSTWMGDRLSSRPVVRCASWDFFVLPDSRKFLFTTRVSDGFVLELGDQKTFGLVIYCLTCLSLVTQYGHLNPYKNNINMIHRRDSK